MRVICVSGLDGAGKSTTAGMLIKLYRYLGLRVWYRWFRWFALFSYPIYLYARLLRRTLVVHVWGYSLRIHVFWIDKVLRWLYPRTLLLDLFLLYIFVSLISIFRKVDILLLDRCFIDALIDLVWETRSVNFLNSVSARISLRLQSRVKTVTLVVDPRIAIRRKKDIVSLKELYFKRRVYEKMSKLFQIPIVDTSAKNPLQTLTNILAQL